MRPSAPEPKPDWAGYLRFRDRIAAATDQRRWPIAWLDDQILRGHFMVWADEAACIVAAVKTYPSGLKDVEGIVAAGEEAAILRLIPRALDWGRAAGCAQGLIESRPGWARRLRRDGWDIHQTTIRKAL